MLLPLLSTLEHAVAVVPDPLLHIVGDQPHGKILSYRLPVHTKGVSYTSFGSDVRSQT